MRIIAGTHRTRQLASPPDDSITRPITDRVKEILFNRLMARGMLGGGTVVDLFSGVGSLGLEALSRGADHCTFVERHRAIRRLLEQNLNDLDMTDRATVLTVDALATDWSLVLPHQPLWLIFVDPPYPMTADEKLQPRFESMIASLAPLTEAEGTLVLRTETPHAFGPIDGWLEPDIERYSKMLVHFYEKP